MVPGASTMSRPATTGAMMPQLSIDAIEAMCWQTLAPVLLDALALPPQAPVVAMGVARVGDPGSTRTVYTTIVVLVVFGVVLAVLSFWVLRRTRPEPELLAPLETMQTRGWRKLDPAAQRRSLDDSRPTGAVPLRREASAPAVDSSFATVAPVASFDDLSDRDEVIDGDLEPDADEDSDLDNADRDDSGGAGGSESDDTGEVERTPVTEEITQQATEQATEKVRDQSDIAEEQQVDADDGATAASGFDDTGEIPDDGEFDIGDEVPMVRSIDPLFTAKVPPPKHPG